jgi:hypothetical protein
VGLFDSPAQWAALGGALGLAAYEPTAAYQPGVGFRALKRALGYPAGHLAPSFTHWFYGRGGADRSVEVMFIAYTVGSGSSSQEMNALVARIDPSLFLGIAIESKPIFEFFNKTPRTLTGDKLVDDNIYISGFDTQRTIGCLALSTLEGRELVSRIVQHKDDLHIGDSIVTFARTGYEASLEDARYRLGMVIFIAQRLAWLKSKLPPTQAEIAQRANWAGFAKEVGFQFDPLRMTTFGQTTRSSGPGVNGAPIKIALETDGQRLCTSVNVRFPREVHVAFTARRSTSPMRSYLAGVFGQDIKIGNPLFDDLYDVSGQPQHLVREVLSHPDLISVMNLLAGSTSEVQLNHRQLIFRVPGFLDATQLHQVCETARITCDALFHRLKAIVE